MYEVTITHDGLGKHQVIRSRDYETARSRANEIEQRWNEQWEKQESKMNGIEEADELNQQILNENNLLQNLLSNTIKKDYKIDYEKEYKIEHEIDYEKNKLTLNFSDIKKEPILDYTLIKEPEEPFSFLLNYVLFFFIISFILAPFIESYDKTNIIPLFFALIIIFLPYFISKTINSIFYKKKLEKTRQEKNIKIKQEAEEKYQQEIDLYKKEEQNFYKEQEEKNKELKYIQEENNNKLKSIIDNYENKIQEYLELAFAKFETPECFPNNFEIEFNDKNDMLIINYYLPDFESLSNIKEHRYIATSDIIKQSFHTEKYMKELYDKMVYQTIFSVLFVIFNSDYKNIIRSVAINGCIDSIDRAIGKNITVCIASLLMRREDFSSLNLSMVSPKESFKRFKGLACVNIDAKIAVAPIVKLNKDDKRFVESYEVAKNINEGTNLAAMDWKDFENLIREIFDKEFSQNGGECKITQASRDGGVDAVIFDPDPIRGGKIVVQAKRYTNIVDLSAVRDLYGTITNERAMKGILITTSDFGSDSYEFVKDKPITLLNGGNLLHLLQKHGQKAYINILEAKKLLQ